MIQHILGTPLSTKNQVTDNKDEDITIYWSSETTNFPNNDAFLDETSSISMVTKQVLQGILKSNTSIVQRNQINYDLPTDVDFSVIPKGMQFSNTTHEQLTTGLYLIALCYISIDTNK